MQDSGKVATCRGRHLPIHSHNNMAEQHFDRLEDNSMTYVSYCCTDVAELNLPPIVFVPLRTNQIYQQSYGKPEMMLLSPWVVEAYKLSTATLSNSAQLHVIQGRGCWTAQEEAAKRVQAPCNNILWSDRSALQVTISASGLEQSTQQGHTQKRAAPQ